ncbi:MAG: pyruvate ferredoxin oxidoreductase [Candidatus Aenigmarchaeota archaeon]|nr:pyruvate ferredoxin oxidoreductase [Candidatus Aenigmarchaeota archaeon]
MMLKDFAKKPKRFVAGGRSCAGCAAPIIFRTVLAATDHPVVAGNATGCMEVTSSIYPFTSWNIPWIHNAFENVSSTISGAESAYRALKKRGKIKETIKFVAFGGDGGTYDIGLQSLSGALERGHDFLYVCYDNGAYMNTGNQRSSATPFGASTTTEPAGKVLQGKSLFRKNLTEIVAAHNIPYVAQASVSNIMDLYSKAKRAFEIEGPKFMVVFSPCTTLWKFPPDQTIQIAKLAVESRFWPLYEIENGKYKINYKPSKEVPVEDFLKTQKRFAHLFSPENSHLIEKIQKHTDDEWEKLLKREG